MFSRKSKEKDTCIPPFGAVPCVNMGIFSCFGCLDRGETGSKQTLPCKYHALASFDPLLRKSKTEK